MQLVVLLLYLVTLAMATTYAVGGVGIALAIFLGLGAILTIECALFQRDRLRGAYSGPGHHHPAH